VTRKILASHGPGVESGKASDLTDSRQGTYDSAANPPKTDTSKTTSRERAQPGAAMQGGPSPHRTSRSLKA